MEVEIASIFMAFIRSIVVQSSAAVVLQRAHVFRNTIVHRMDWHTLHCPVMLCNHLRELLSREIDTGCTMAIACDFIFASLINQDTFFTDRHELVMSDVPAGPMQ
jgi:hypothetical protein